MERFGVGAVDSMSHAVRGSSGRSRPASALGRAPPLKSSFNGNRDEKEASLGRKDSKEAYKGQSMSEKVC